MNQAITLFTEIVDDGLFGYITNNDSCDIANIVPTKFGF